MQADFISISWENETKNKKKKRKDLDGCESPVENFGDRTVSI